MRKAQKKQAEDFVTLLGQAHEEMKSLIMNRRNAAAMDLLGQCQEGAIALGSLIERTEGEGFRTIPFLEEYCDLTYGIYIKIEEGEEVSAEDVYKQLQESLRQIEYSVEHDIKIRLEIAFLPYKASMWDSMESIWMAADGDPDCDAYVVPIPYYERNSDGFLGTYHYEGNELPEGVPVTDYGSYHLETRQPDIIYIHNPYDQSNYVTSVDPEYYSSRLKKYTKLLVYVPYYATSGGMNEGQSLCPAYYHADYIITQAKKYHKFFDASIPREKLLPLGSPKFDRVIRLCSNPLEPPVAWKNRMEGKKVYFYNTSIGGMLTDTKKFLMKMDYVFQCFRSREDACLVWRPHPLLETTLDSMRRDYRVFYDTMKQNFIEQNWGIFDDTSDIEQTIAYCDVYIGDAATSVTALFGIAGKPLFILNPEIYTSPEEEDWRGEIISCPFVDGRDDWMITQGNKLYHSPHSDYHYEYYCDLSEYTSGDYYLRAIEINQKIYVCPQNAQDMLIISDHKIEKRITLERQIEQAGAFCNMWNIGTYLFLVPFRYPAIVRYDITNDKVDYIKEYHDLFVKQVQGEWRCGGSWVWNQYLLLASPADNQVLAIESESMEVELLTTGSASKCGCGMMRVCGDEVYMLPYMGTTITRWNLVTGDVREYSHMPDGFSGMERPFHLAAVYQNQIVLPPINGNMFVSIDMETGTAEEWEPPFHITGEGKNGYYSSWSAGAFMNRTDTLGAGTYRFFEEAERKLYDINLVTKEFREIEIVFRLDELLLHEPGFGRKSDWLKYGCEEGALYSLKDFLDGAAKGHPFDREAQVEAYGEIAANHDGTCGEMIHQLIRTKV